MSDLIIINKRLVEIQYAPYGGAVYIAARTDDRAERTTVFLVAPDAEIVTRAFA